jgi:hypothetical protein
MATRWYILATLAGVVAAVSVWAWPIGPRWRSGPDAGLLEWISPDGKTLTTTQGHFGITANPEVSRWDTATGALLSRAEMQCTGQSSTRKIQVSADGRIALVGEGVLVSERIGDHAGMLNFRNGKWYVHDGVTGLRRVGPIAGVVVAWTLSPDNRWFTGNLTDPIDGFDKSKGLFLFSTTSGECIPLVPPRDDVIATFCVFTQDSTSAAVSWRPNKGEPADVDHVIQIIELPSGRPRRQFVLPRRDWVRLDRWDGRYLRAVAYQTADRQRRMHYRFDATQDPVGDGVAQPLFRESINGPQGTH